MIGIAWPDASQHIFYTRYDSEQDTYGVVETYWSAGVGWNTRAVPGPPVLSELSTFVGADGPHLVYGGGAIPGVQYIFDLWWDGGQWISAQVTDIGASGSLAAYATPNGQNHVIYPEIVDNPPGQKPLSGALMYLSWSNNHDGTVNLTFQDDVYNLVNAAGGELGAVWERGPLVAYANPDGSEWCFFPEAGPTGPLLGQLWALNINNDALISSVDVVSSAGCPPVAQASGLTAYSIWIGTPILLQVAYPAGSQHVFFTDGAHNIWEASTGDGLNYTAANLSEEAGADAVPAWYQQDGGSPAASPLAGFITFSYPPPRRWPFDVGLPEWLRFPIVTQWIFYVGEDDELHYISVDDNSVSGSSLRGVNGNAPDLPPTLLDAYMSPDGTWHVNYSGGNSLQEVYWLNGDWFPNTLAQL